MDKYQQKYGTLKNKSIPISEKLHPEMDNSELLNAQQHKHYQHIIGVCQWLVHNARFDICYAVASLSRFQASLRKNHLKEAQKILGYIKKISKKVSKGEPKDVQKVSKGAPKLYPKAQKTNVQKPQKLNFPDPQTSQRLPELNKNHFFDEF